VVGMGGQGKTTLTKKVFDNNKVVEHFDYRVWITVSHSYNIEGASIVWTTKYIAPSYTISI